MAEESLRKALRISYLASLAVAMTLGGAFLAVTSLVGDHNALTRYGGAAWVFLLALVVALPTLTPLMKRRYRS